MKSLDQLLERKIVWMKRFIATSQSMLISLDGDFDSKSIDIFEQNRNTLLKIIDDINNAIVEKYSNLVRSPEGISAELRDKIRFYNTEKERILKEVEAVDQMLIQKMEETKDALAKQMKSLHTGRQLISKYKGTSRPSESLDRTL